MRDAVYDSPRLLEPRCSLPTRQKSTRGSSNPSSNLRLRVLAETSNAGDPPCSLSVLSPSLGSYHRRGTGATPARARATPPRRRTRVVPLHARPRRAALMRLMRACVRARARAPIRVSASARTRVRFRRRRDWRSRAQRVRRARHLRQRRARRSGRETLRRRRHRVLQ